MVNDKVMKHGSPANARRAGAQRPGGPSRGSRFDSRTLAWALVPLAMSLVVLLPLLGCDAQEGTNPSPKPRATDVTLADQLTASGRFQGAQRFTPDSVQLSYGQSQSQARPQSGFSILAAKDPVLVDIHAGSVREIMLASPKQRRELASRAVAEVVAAVDAYPRRLVAVRLRDASISFHSLPVADQEWLIERVGVNAAAVYESAVAALLDEVIDAVGAERGEAAVTVLGLPVEPGRIGFEAAQQTNERYGVVIDELDPFVSLRWFMLLGSGLAEEFAVVMAMPEAVRFRSGRPIIFRTNGMWRMLVGADESGYDEYAATTGGDELVAEGFDETADGESEITEWPESDERDAMLTNDPFDELADTSDHGGFDDGGGALLTFVRVGPPGGGSGSGGTGVGGGGGGAGAGGSGAGAGPANVGSSDDGSGGSGRAGAGGGCTLANAY